MKTERTILGVIIMSLILWGWNAHAWQVLCGERWGLLLAGVSLLAIREIKFKSLIYPITLWYFVLSALVSSFRIGEHGVWSPSTVMLLQHSSLSSLALLLCFVLFLRSKILVRTPYLILQICAGIVLIGFLLGNARIQVPFLDNPSIAASFVVLAFLQLPKYGPMLGACAVFMTGAIAPALGLGTYLFWKVKSGFKWLFAPMLIGAAAYLVIHIPNIDSGRFGTWAAYWDWWGEGSIWRYFLGSGFGTTPVWNTIVGIQSAIHKETTLVAPWLHNDWLQLFFETGIMGMALVMGCVVDLMLRLPREKQAVMLAYFAVMTINYPLHYPIVTLLGWVMAKDYVVEKVLEDK